VRLALVLLLLSAGAAAQSPPAVSVGQAWSRATPPGVSVGVAYFEITNGGAADALLAVSSPVAERAEMHSTTMAGGLMEMREVHFVDVPAKGRVVFEPGGLHVMLVNLEKPLIEGTRVPLTLVFRHAGKVSVAAVVQGVAGGAPVANALPHDGYRLATWPAHAGSPNFALRDADDRARTLVDYRGRVVVVFFGFVHCPDVCPAELFKLASAMKQLGALANRVRVVFITLDPERDTREVLRSYVAAFDPRFIGLTGTPAQIDRAAGSFFVEYARVGSGSDYTIDHSSSTFVLDATGHLRLVGTAKTSTADYAHDLEALIAESD
jgi:protein SCO1/2